MICASIKSRDNCSERCTNKAKLGTEWCGVHRTTQIRFQGSGTSGASAAAASPPLSKPTKNRHAWIAPTTETATAASRKIQCAFRRNLARRAGPLLYNRELSNNPCDFFTSDPIEEISFGEFVSFVDADAKGYCMDIKSAVSLLEHAEKSKEVPLNPFNREPLPAIFIQRIKRHRGRQSWNALKPLTEEQRQSLEITDVFRLMEDQGYYTDPQWFLDLERTALQRLYIELADIWFHRASLSPNDQRRIIPPPKRPFKMAVRAVLIMTTKALRALVLETCRTLVSAALEASDRRLGVMYFLGALSCVTDSAAVAYPWLVEMFAPGCATRVGLTGDIQILHPSILAY